MRLKILVWNQQQGQSVVQKQWNDWIVNQELRIKIKVLNQKETNQPWVSKHTLNEQIVIKHLLIPIKHWINLKVHALLSIKEVTHLNREHNNHVWQYSLKLCNYRQLFITIFCWFHLNLPSNYKNDNDEGVHYWVCFGDHSIAELHYDVEQKNQ